jgi:hypothetical protein
MDKRTSSSLSAALAGAAVAAVVMGITGIGHAADTGNVPDERAPARVAPKKQVAIAPPAASPAPAPPATDDPYRCHPSEDIACTIVRETLSGTLIVTLRPVSPRAAAPAWTVVSGAPPTPGPHPGGTVYVVPNVAPSETASWPHQVALMPANGAPILE